MISGLGRSPGEGKGYPLQYSDLENSMDYIVHGVAEMDITEQLSLSLSTTQFSSVAQLCLTLFATPWTVACQASLSITNSWSLLKLMSIESVMPSNHLILCQPLLLPPSIFPSIRVFSSDTVLCLHQEANRVAKSGTGLSNFHN